MRFFTQYRVALLAACVAIVLSTSVFMGQQRPAGAPNPGGPGVSVERGKYFVTVQDCNGCHTPFKNGEPDLTKMMMGHPQDAPKGSRRNRQIEILRQVRLGMTRPGLARLGS